MRSRRRSSLRSVRGRMSPRSGALTGGRCALLIDTYEVLAPLDDWLRARFLPELPDGTVVVIAGRSPPAPAWREDAGWRDLLRVVSLRNLSPDEGSAYLAVAASRRTYTSRSCGSPMGIRWRCRWWSTCSQGAGDTVADSIHMPDVVHVLVNRFLDTVPGPLHRRALEVCAHARVTTEDLLRVALEVDDAHELFTWLRGLSFVQQGPAGLFPHDLARQVIDADLRWRDRDSYTRIHRGIRRRLVQRARQAHGREQQQALLDMLFLSRNNPVVGPLFDWASFESGYAAPAGPGDRAAMLGMTERHEGPASAALAAHWLDRQPRAFTVVRDTGVEPLGFLCHLDLTEASSEERGADPGARSVWTYVARHGPPRPGETVLMLRFAMDRDVHQRKLSTGLSLVTVTVSQRFLTPRLAWDAHVVADPDYWGAWFAHIDYQRAEEADFDVDGRRFGVFVRDWRREGFDAWLDRMGERALGDEHDPAVSPAQAAPVLVLSQPEFADAVRQALRDLHRPGQLVRSLLVRSRIVGEHAGQDQVAVVLRDLLLEAIEVLDRRPQDDKLLRAVDRTYLRSAGTQAIAAEVLGLPFSTYRRHLTAGVTRIVEWLWRRELYGDDSAAGEQH